MILKVKQLRELLEKTTPDWTYSFDDVFKIPKVLLGKHAYASFFSYRNVEDAKFAAEARTTMPELLDTLEDFVSVLKEIQTPVPDDECPNCGDEDEAEKWFAIACKRKRMARDVLKKYNILEVK